MIKRHVTQKEYVKYSISFLSRNTTG